MSHPTLHPQNPDQLPSLENRTPHPEMNGAPACNPKCLGRCWHDEEQRKTGDRCLIACMCSPALEDL